MDFSIDVCSYLVKIVDILTEAEDRLPFGKFDMDYGRIWHQKFTDCFDTLMRLEPYAINSLEKRILEFSQTKHEDDIPTLFSIVRYMFYILSTVDNMCVFQDEEKPTIGLQTSYASKYSDTIEKLTTKATPDILNNQILNEFHVIASKTRSNSINPVSFFITNEILKLASIYGPNMYQSQNKCVDLKILRTESVDITRYPDFVLAELEPVKHLKTLTAKQHGQIFFLQAKAYEAKVIYSLAIERAKSACEAFTCQKDKHQMKLFIERLEQTNQKKNKNKCLEAKQIEKGLDIVAVDEIEEMASDTDKLQTDELFVFDEYIEPIIQAVEHQLTCGEFNTSVAQQFHEDIHNYLLSRKAMPNSKFQEFQLLMHLTRVVNNILQHVEDTLGVWIGVLRFSFHVVVLFDESCIMDESRRKDPHTLLFTELYDTLKFGWERLLAFETSIMSFTNFLRELIQLAKVALSNGNANACCFITEDIHRLQIQVPLFMFNEVENNEILIEVLCLHTKSVEIKMFPDYIMDLSRQILALPNLTNVKKAEVLETQSSVYKVKQIYSLAIERAKEACESYQSFEDKQRLTVLIKSLEILHEKKERKKTAPPDIDIYDEEKEEEYYMNSMIDTMTTSLEGEIEKTIVQAEFYLTEGTFDQKKVDLFDKEILKFLELNSTCENRNELENKVFERLCVGIVHIMQNSPKSEITSVNYLRLFFHIAAVLQMCYSESTVYLPNETHSIIVKPVFLNMFHAVVFGIMNLDINNVKKDVVKLCREVALYAETLLNEDSIKNNPICFFICKESCGLMNLIEAVTNELVYSKVLRKIYLVHSSCCFVRMELDNVIYLCKNVLRLTPQDDQANDEDTNWKIQALEQQARSFQIKNKIDVALKKAQEAHEISKREVDKARLDRLIRDLKSKEKENLAKARENHNLDIGSHVEEIQICTNQRRKQKETDKIKKKRRRYKKPETDTEKCNTESKTYVSPTEELLQCLDDTDFHDGFSDSCSSFTSSVTSRTNTNDNNSTISDDIIASLSYVVEDEPDCIEDVNEPEEDVKPPKETWYEISQAIHDGKKKKLDFCLQYDIDLECSFDFENNLPTWEPFYPHLMTRNDMEYHLNHEPNKYKRCIIFIDSAQLAICKPLDSTAGEQIKILGRSKCGQTFHEDEVCVEIYDCISVKNNTDLCGKVVGILERKRHKDVDTPVFICTVSNDEAHLMRPICKTIPKISILHNRVIKQFPNICNSRIELYKIVDKKFKFKSFFDIYPEKREDYLFVVVFLSWNSKFAYPKGMVIDVILNSQSYSRSLKILDMQHNINPLYPREVMEEVKQIPQEAYLSQYHVIEVITIDPEGSRDLDDALSVEYKSENEYLVGVHIADVASIVKKGSCIDELARQRAVSFYPTKWRNIHMLPEPLSEIKCSLIEGEIRQTISVYFKMNSNGEELQDPVVKKSVVRSIKQLTYHEAQKIIDGQSVEAADVVITQLKCLSMLSKSIRKNRIKDRRFLEPFNENLTHEDFDEDDKEAHNLVEEYMIMANAHIAKILTKNFPSGVPVRIQKIPDKTMLTEWFTQNNIIGNVVINLQDAFCESNQGCKSLSLNTAADGSGNQGHLTIQRNVWNSISKLVNSDRWERVQRILCMDDIHPNQLIVQKRWNKIMEKAQYGCSSKLKTELNHYSLKINPYTHFTSPIRRYFDLMVQRFVHSYLDKKKAPYSSSEIQLLCAHINERTKQQKSYGRQTQIIKAATEIRQKPVEFKCIISHSNDDIVGIEIPKWKFLTDTSKEISFHLLDVCEKPELKGEYTTTTWKKRSYHTLGTQVSVRPKLKSWEALEISPIQHCIYMPVDKWAKLVTNVLGSLDTDSGTQNRKKCKAKAKQIVDEIGEEGLNPPVRLGSAETITCEATNITAMMQLCRFRFTFAPGRVISAQMSSVIEKGLLQPKICLVHLAKNVSFCLEHKDNPVTCFTKVSTESTVQRKWANVIDYVKVWTSLVEMEAAVVSVQSGDSFFIEHVNLKFISKSNGYVYLTKSFCEQRNVFGFNISMKYKEMCASDFLCLRFTVDKLSNTSYTWVGHGKMTSVIEEEGDWLKLSFELHTNYFPLSLQRKAAEGLCEGLVFTIEIIPRPETERLIRHALQVKHIENIPLAKAIALNRPKPKLDGDHYQLGTIAERDIADNILTRLGLPRNNIGQYNAIDKALTSSFTLIQGPPGTGKTYTGIKLVYLFAKINRLLMNEKAVDENKEEHQVLYCGPSNKSVDVVARGLRKRLGYKCPKVIRMYGKTIENEDFPLPEKTHTRAINKEGKCPKDLYDIALHHIIRKGGKPYAEDICKLDQIFKKEIERPESQNITHLTIKRYRTLINKATASELPNYEVILCTAAIAGSQKLVKMTNIFQCIIDECGMCTEPECLLPIIMLKPRQVVLIGDHKQLHPIVLCSQAAKLGLEHSLFERYADEAVFLNRQYRMHPQICEFPSAEFYDGKLETAPSSLWKIDKPLSFLPKDKVMLFYHVEGEEESLTVHTDDGHERSKSNEVEAQKAMDLFLFMVRHEKVNPKHINIMTQYKSQMSVIQKKLKDLNFDITVNTVVASQGGEWDYVILSTVRSLPRYKIESSPTKGWISQNLGFLSDEHQTNVALTRARKGLFIIGNKNLLQCDKVWKKLLQHYDEKGCIKGGRDIPSTNRTSFPISYR